MPLVFKTPKDSSQPVDIAGVGVLPAGGVGGLPVAVAAARGHAALVHQDAAGWPATNEDGTYKVLEGSALAAAARQWAETNGVEAVNVQERDIANLQAEAGGVVDEYPDARTKAEEEYQRQQPPEAVAAAIDAQQEEPQPAPPAPIEEGGAA